VGSRAVPRWKGNPATTGDWLPSRWTGIVLVPTSVRCTLERGGVRFPMGSRRCEMTISRLQPGPRDWRASAGWSHHVVRVGHHRPGRVGRPEDHARSQRQGSAVELPAGRAELKVTSVDVSLVGAKGKNAKILVEVEHSGNAENRTRIGAVKVLTAPALRGFVYATTDESVPSPDPDQPFWGRSPAALWHLKIDSTELSGGTPTKKLDLTGLTEIQLAIGYRFAKGSGG
jgi:hypothetical protein